MAGLARGLGAAAVGALGKSGRAGLPKIAAGGAPPVVPGQGGAQVRRALLASVAQRPGDDLSRAPTKRHPPPERLRLGRHEAPEFIEFKHVAVLARQQGVHARGKLLGFFPPPAHHRQVTNPEGAVNAAQAHAVLVGGQHLVLELRAMTRPSGREGKRPLALHAECPLRAALRAAVLLQAFAATVRAGLDPRRRNHPASSRRFGLDSTSA